MADMNKSVRGFGSYGDILIRDRKMYVVPTPFRLVNNVAHHQTLILPAADTPGNDFISVGDLCRRETANLVIGYSFNLQTNELMPETIPNPGAGREHLFRAWRLADSPTDVVSMRAINTQPEAVDDDEGTEG